MFETHAIFIDISNRFYLLHGESYFKIECDILVAITNETNDNAENGNSFS